MGSRMKLAKTAAWKRLAAAALAAAIAGGLSAACAVSAQAPTPSPAAARAYTLQHSQHNEETASTDVTGLHPPGCGELVWHQATLAERGSKSPIFFLSTVPDDGSVLLAYFNVDTSRPLSYLAADGSTRSISVQRDWGTITLPGASLDSLVWQLL